MPARIATLALLVTAALAAAGQPPARLKPGEVALTIYTPYYEDDEDFERNLRYAASQIEHGGDLDDYFFRDWSDEHPPSTHAVLEAQARYLGLGVVRECRTVALRRGVSECRFADVAAMLDATTTRLVDQTDPEGTAVVEQNFLYDLVNAEALLKRFVDQPVELIDAKGKSHAGTLLSPGPPLMLRTRRGAVETIQTGHTRRQARGFFDEYFYPGPARAASRPFTLRFPRLPEGFVTRPTLAWKLEARQPGDHDVVVSYQTGGMAWRADYTAVLSPDETHLDLGGWVTIANVCGARFPNARVKLIAGDVRRVNTPNLPDLSMAQDFFGAEEEEPQFEEKAFFEYHLYTLRRTTTLENNQTKQIEFLRAPAVPVKKVYTYDAAVLGDPFFGDAFGRDESYGTKCRRTVRAHVEFENSKGANLGMPLPAGVVRLYKRDEADDALEFLGGDSIGHTPRDETVRLYVGDAFDLIGQRLRKSYEEPDYYHIRESFEIELRNHKPTPVTVFVLEHLYRYVNWKIEKSSLPSKQLDDESVEFALPVPANGKATVSYTVLYSWPPATFRIEGNDEF